MISMTVSDTNNGVNRAAVFHEGASTGRVAEGQQPEPSLYPATSAKESRLRKRRRKRSVEENRALMKCHSKSNLKERRYRLIMLRLWELRKE